MNHQEKEEMEEENEEDMESPKRWDVWDPPLHHQLMIATLNLKTLLSWVILLMEHIAIVNLVMIFL
jgi:hypothetical protein